MERNHSRIERHEPATGSFPIPRHLDFNQVVRAPALGWRGALSWLGGGLLLLSYLAPFDSPFAADTDGSQGYLFGLQLVGTTLRDLLGGQVQSWQQVQWTSLVILPNRLLLVLVLAHFWGKPLTRLPTMIALQLITLACTLTWCMAFQAPLPFATQVWIAAQLLLATGMMLSQRWRV